MSKEIIISVSGDQSRIAIVEDGELVELYVESPDNIRTIGDIYLARIKRILPGIKAAFVDIGQKQDAFLHFSDLSDNVPALLELSDGRVPDRTSDGLGKAPAGDPDALELETPEEQLATERRREKQREPARSRRGRGKADEAEATTAESAEAGTVEAQPEAERPARRRGRSRKADAPAGDGVPPAPAILPPDAPGATPSAEDDDAPDAAAHDDARQPDDEDGKPRRRRRGRRRKKSAPDAPAGAEAADQEEAVASGEPPEAEAAPEPRKRAPRSRRGRAAESEPAADEEAVAADAPDAEAATETPGETKPRTPRKSSRSRKATPEAGEAETAPEPESEPAPKRGRSRKAASKTEAEVTKPAADAPAGEAKTAGPAADAPAEAGKPASDAPAGSAETAKPEAPNRLAPGSRFRIDLTSKPGRAPSRREEEEEEEEQPKTSRRGRRGGRRGGKRGGSNDASEAAASGESTGSREPAGRSKEADDEDDRRGGGNGKGNGKSGGNGRRPESFLKQDQRILVKIIKEPISQKGSRVSTDISLAGRFLVLIPAADYIAVSKKIESAKERRRLRALARSLLPEGYGLIVRTVAADKDAKALDLDLQLLLDKWKKVEEQLKKRPNPPVQLYEDVSMVSSIIRDLFSEDYDRIVIDDPTLYRNVKSYVQAVAPQMVDAVQLHQRKEPVFRAFNVERDVRAAFESRVSLPGGGYLFIEHTEAMHVVDVNSGRAGRGMSQEENALKVNLEAAREIAKQLRLRDLGGIICVDFIDMRSDSYRRKVYDELKKAFRRDRAVTKLLPMSDFGVVEITRQRLRPSITTTLDVDDIGPAPPDDEDDVPMPPKATSSLPPGPQRSATDIVAHLERWLQTYRNEVQDRHKKRPILLRVHPFLAAFLERGFPSLLTRWRFRTRLKLVLDVDESVDPLAFIVRDEKSGKNLTRKYDPDQRAAAD